MHLVPEVPGGLRVQPELRTRAKGSLEPERGIRRHASLPLHNLVHALKGYTNRPRELNLGNSKRAKELCRPPSSTARPSRVIRPGFTRRSSSGVFNAASRRWICRVTAEGVRHSRSAARCNEPDSTRTTNVRISSSMTQSQLLVEQYDIAKIAFDASEDQAYAFVRGAGIPHQRTAVSHYLG